MNKNITAKKLKLYVSEINSLLKATNQEVSESIILGIIFIQFIDIMKQRNTFDINRYVEGDLQLNKVQSDDEYEAKVMEFAKLNEGLGELIQDSISHIRLCGEDALTRKLRSYNQGFYDYDGDFSELFKEAIYLVSKRENITPKSIYKLISSLLSDIEAKKIYDGVVGSGNLLTEVIKNRKEINVFGQDINSELLKICKMNLILSGNFESIKNIKQGNTITDPAFVDENNKICTYDIVVSDIPIAVRDYGFMVIQDDKYNRFHRGIPSKVNADYAFITHMVESIDENGIGILLVPSGTLFRSGMEGKIRKEFIEENIIDCVISLPNNMLYRTRVAVNLLIFKKNRKSDDILFIDASNLGEVKQKIAQLEDASIAHIKSVYDKREDIDGFSKNVALDKIKENDVNLAVLKYVYKETKKELDFEKLSLEARQLSEKLYDIGKELDSKFRV